MGSDEYGVQFDSKSSQRLYSYYDPSSEKFGFKNQNNQVVIQPIFDRIENYSSGFYCISLRKEKEIVYGYVGRDGLFLAPRYERADSFDKGFVYWYTDYFGYMLRSGKMVDNRCVEKQVNGLMILNHSVTEDVRHKILNLCGDVIFTFPEDVLTEPGIVNEDGFSRINEYGEYYAGWYIEPDGILTRSKLDGTKRLYAASIEYKLCYINNNSEIVFEADQYDEIFDFASGLARVRIEDRYGFINEKGELVIPVSLDSCGDFSDGLVYFRCRENEPFSGSIWMDSAMDSMLVSIELMKEFIGNLPQWLQKAIEEALDCFTSTTEGITLSQTEDTYTISIDYDELISDPSFSNLPPPADNDSSCESSDGDDVSSKQELTNDEMTLLYIEFLNQFEKCCQCWGQIDTAGEVVTEPQIGPLHSAENSPKPFLYIQSGIPKYGYIDHSWSFVIPPIFDRADTFDGDVASVSVNEKEGIINRSGKYVVEPIYDRLSSVELTNQDNVSITAYRADINNKTLFLDEKGEVIVESPQGRLEEFLPGIFKYGDLWSKNVGVVDSSGKVIFEAGKYYRFDRISDLYFSFRADHGLYGIGSKEGVVISPRFYEFKAIGEGIFLAQENSKQSDLSFASEKYIVNDQLDFYLLDKNIYIDKNFSEGLAVVSNSVYYDGPWGYINEKGTRVISCMFSNAKPFCKGRAQVQINGLWGIIDQQGEFIAPPILDDICGEFHNGYVWVVYKGKIYKMDIEGRLYIGDKFFGHVYSPIPKKSGDKWGYVNRNGDFTIPPIYDKAGYFNLDYAQVRQGEWKIKINYEGSIIDAELDVKT